LKLDLCFKQIEYWFSQMEIAFECDKQILYNQILILSFCRYVAFIVILILATADVSE